MTVLSRETAYGRWESGHVDAQPAREHVQKLIAAGIGIRRIAQLSGVGRKSVQQLLRGRTDRGTGPTKKLMRSTADKLLAVEVPAVTWRSAAAATPVDATGTRRRLQALIADGHTQLELAAAIGWSQQNLSPLVHGTGQVSADTARKVAALFDGLQMTPGSNAWARRRGAEFGWPLPMEWDEDAIDDPKVGPSRPELDEVPNQRQAAAARVAALEEWLARPEQLRGTVEEFAAAHGVTARTVERDKARLRMGAAA
ncbi:hypothetical protein ACXYTP_19220 [Tsukamurella ocularis]|uniref:hypothetical protein n=1 Tax=Tsukamurella ocularis TaxID=1970234 RepID=UPI0039EEECCD